MKVKNLLVGFALLILFQSPLILAVSCNQVSPSNYNSCLEILKSKLSESEKEILISNLEYENKFFPDHQFIFNSNEKIEIKSAPEGVEVINKQFIKNAWADILSLMPSVLYNDLLYVPEKTSVFTGFNYEIDIPANYYSSDYPEKKNGDCKTKYYLKENEVENKIYVNNKYVGKGDFSDVSISRDSEIKVELSILVEVKIKHYKWERYCSSRRDDGSCRRYSEDCEYHDTELKKEEIKISDSVEVKKYNNVLSANVYPVSAYADTTTLKVETKDSVEVSFQNSEYDFYEYIYDIDSSKAPYYFYTLKASDYNQEKLSNLFKTGENLIVNNPKNCKIKVFDFFNFLEKDCGSPEESVEFFIKTDKLRYKEGEEIKVDIYPSDVSVEVHYANQKKNVKGFVSFTAVLDSNKITAEHKNFKAEKIIYVSNKERLLLIWNLIIFTFLNYFLFVVLRKYARKIA